MLLYDFEVQFVEISRETLSFHSVSTVSSFVKTPSLSASIGADLPLLSLIVAEVTAALVFTENVTLSQALTVFPGSTCILLNVLSVAGS